VESKQLHAVANVVFALPLHSKLRYALQRGVSRFGYKPAGTVKTADQRQHPQLSRVIQHPQKNTFTAPTPTPTPESSRKGNRGHPPLLKNHKPLLQSFAHHPPRLRHAYPAHVSMPTMAAGRRSLSLNGNWKMENGNGQSRSQGTPSSI
jgi:hypothetical protein